MAWMRSLWSPCALALAVVACVRHPAPVAPPVRHASAAPPPATLSERVEARLGDRVVRQIEWTDAIPGEHVVALVAEGHDAGRVRRVLTWARGDEWVEDVFVPEAMGLPANSLQSYGVMDVDGRAGTELVFFPADAREGLLILSLGPRAVSGRFASAEPLDPCPNAGACQLRALRTAAAVLEGVRDEAGLRAATPLSALSRDSFLHLSPDARMASLVYAPPERLRELIDPDGITLCLTQRVVCSDLRTPTIEHVPEGRCERLPRGEPSVHAIERLVRPRTTPASPSPNLVESCVNSFSCRPARPDFAGRGAWLTRIQLVALVLECGP